MLFDRDPKNEQKVMQVLDELKLDNNMMGYHYLIDALLVLSPGSNIHYTDFNSLTIIVGGIHEVSGGRVYSAMKNVIEKAFKKRDKKVWGTYFHSLSEPSPQYFITNVYSKLWGK